MTRATLFINKNLSLPIMIIKNPDDKRYGLTNFTPLPGFDLDLGISSVEMNASGRTLKSHCILYNHNMHHGAFKAMEFHGERAVNTLSSFDNKTSSVLMVNHHPGPNYSLLSVQKFAMEQMTQLLDSQLKNVDEAKRNGPVIASMDIDLPGFGGTDLLRVQIPLEIITPSPFSNYAAKARYWIHLFLNSKNVLQGRVVKWGYWVEGGILTGSIVSRLKPVISDNATVVEAHLNASLKELDFHTWHDVYLMPGTCPGIDEDYHGNTFHDVTIVLPFTK